MHEICSVDEEASSIRRADVIYLQSLSHIVCLVFSQGYNRAMLTMPDGAMISIEEARVLCTYGTTAWDGARNWFPESEVRKACVLLLSVGKLPLLRVQQDRARLRSHLIPRISCVTTQSLVIEISWIKQTSPVGLSLSLSVAFLVSLSSDVCDQRDISHQTFFVTFSCISYESLIKGTYMLWLSC